MLAIDSGRLLEVQRPPGEMAIVAEFHFKDSTIDGEANLPPFGQIVDARAKPEIQVLLMLAPGAERAALFVILLQVGRCCKRSAGKN